MASDAFKTGREAAVRADLGATYGQAAADAIVDRWLRSGQASRIPCRKGSFLVTESDMRRHAGIWGEVALRAAATVPVDRARLDGVLADISFKPDDAQRAAIELMIGERLTLVHGGAGTGKSTVAKALTRYLDGLEDGRRVVAAFSARVAESTAAKCGVRGTTLHALTGTIPGEEHHPGAPIDPEVTTIIVDEAFSMEPGILHRLLRLSEPTIRIVLLGDVAQLPPIGGGRPLVDLLELEAIPSVKLSTGHRLSGSPHLARQAARVANGQAPLAGPGLTIVQSTPGRASGERMMADHAATLHRRATAGGRSCVVLTPTRYGEAGHEAIARLIARRSAPGPGDEVITTSAHVDRHWRNGERGRVDECGTTITFTDGRTIPYSGEASVAFGTAMSAHRAQGLEYDEVVIVLTRGGSRNATRQLLVSAMTRAPRCTLIVDPGLLADIAKRDEVAERAPLMTRMGSRR